MRSHRGSSVNVQLSRHLRVPHPWNRAAALVEGDGGGAAVLQCEGKADVVVLGDDEGPLSHESVGEGASLSDRVRAAQSGA
jgi:hypothetical protein